MKQSSIPFSRGEVVAGDRMARWEGDIASLYAIQPDPLPDPFAAVGVEVVSSVSVCCRLEAGMP